MDIKIHYYTDQTTNRLISAYITVSMLALKVLTVFGLTELKIKRVLYMTNPIGRQKTTF